MDVLLPIIVAVVASGGTWLTLRNQNKKLDAEGAQILVDTALKLVEPLENKIKLLEGRVLLLEEGRRIDRELVGMLSQQLIDNELQPVTRTEAAARLGLEHS